MDTPGRGSPVSASVTFPVMVFSCPSKPNERKRSGIQNLNFRVEFIIGIAVLSIKYNL
jgi:hypothetical protein